MMTIVSDNSIHSIHVAKRKLADKSTIFHHQIKQVAVKLLRPKPAIIQERKKKDNPATAIEAGDQIDHILQPS